MKDKNLLFEEELARVRESRIFKTIAGVEIICGLVIASRLVYKGDLAAAVVVLVFFTVIGIIFLVIIHFEYRRDYRDKLKELRSE